MRTAARPSRRLRTVGASARRTTGDHVFAAIYGTVRSIPRGRVATYGEVAVLAGMPGAARTVGWALRALDEQSARSGGVPWHRVVGAGGRISLGDTPAGQLQRERLRREGVRLANGRVPMSLFGLGLRRPRRSARLTASKI